jgi:hypothetical protein
MPTSYSAPRVYLLGTVSELTAQNKVGHSSDGFTTLTGLLGTPGLPQQPCVFPPIIGCPPA